MASQHEVRRRPSEPVAAARVAATTLASSPEAPRSRRDASPRFEESTRACRDNASANSMPPPPVPRGDASRRHLRAASTVSRHKNRLSLTLPVALPLGEAARMAGSPITIASGMAPSIPSTPLERPGSVTPPSNANEFIIAVAAQERRVLELREELARAETDLAKLKKQWASEEVYRKRSDSQRSSVGNPAVGTDDDTLAASRRSVELDRRKLLLQTQTAATPPRRKVIRGGHTRTLSLLSPVKTDGAFSTLDEIKSDAITLPPVERRTAQLTNPNLAKRASWQPRQQQSVQAVGVPQMVEDFKSGLRAFVEDIRQITVGDEPVTSQPPRSTPSVNHCGDVTVTGGDEVLTRPIQLSRARTIAAPDRFSTATSTQVKTPEPKAKTGRMKHFSWTPLGVDSLDDTDWSSWDSPASAKSARWSGSTINSSGIDDTPSVPEKKDEDGAEPTKKATANEAPLLSPMLEELLPSIISRLSPSNLKRTANNLIDEWEKSLVTPEIRGKGSRA